MSNPRTVRAVIALAALAGAIAGYFLIVPDTGIQMSLLSRLLVTSTGVKGVAATPTYDAPLPTASSPFTAVSTAYEKNPASTGSYARNWFGPTASGASIDLSVDLLPTRSVALTTLSEAGIQDLEAVALQVSEHTVRLRYVVPGGAAVLYVTPRQAPKTGAPVPGAAADYSFGRAVVRITITGAIATKDSLDALAAKELAVIRRVEPTFPSLLTTSYSALETVIYWIVAVFLIVSIALIPDWVRRGRSRRAAHELLRQRRQFQVRGSKALKRHRVKI